MTSTLVMTDGAARLAFRDDFRVPGAWQLCVMFTFHHWVYIGTRSLNILNVLYMYMYLVHVIHVHYTHVLTTNK